jgi:uncharacterized membrane protein YphA (DoxX/SURF4 family)
VIWRVAWPLLSGAEILVPRLITDVATAPPRQRMEASVSRRALLRSFVAFHWTLGTVVLVQSVHTLGWALAAWGNDPVNVHLALLAGVETVAALLFLVPRTLRVGATLLLATFAVAIVAHVFRLEFPAPLLVYGAGTVFVMVHGNPRARRPLPASA